MIPDSFIQELLQRSDIVDIIEGYVPLKKRGANFVACCPFHSEKTPSFYVSPAKQFYYCFGCAASGTAIGFVMAHLGLNFVDAIGELAKRSNLSVPNVVGNHRHKAKENYDGVLAVLQQSAKFYQNQLLKNQQAQQYLITRGISSDTCKKFAIGYAADDWQGLKEAVSDYNSANLLISGMVIEKNGKRYDRFRQRIMIPIINQQEQIIAFGGRIIDQGEPKYLNSPETPLFTKGNELFGLPQARQAIRKNNSVIVVEGYMDVIVLNQFGVEHAVATLGTATSEYNIKKLLRQVDRLIFCFDGDNAGRKAAWRALENALPVLIDGKRVDFAFLPSEHDPDSFIRQFGSAVFLQKMNEATPLSELLINHLKSTCDLSIAEGRSQLVSSANSLLPKIAAPLLQAQLVKAIAELSEFSVEEVEKYNTISKKSKRLPERKQRYPLSLAKKILSIIVNSPDLLPSLAQFYQQHLQQHLDLASTLGNRELTEIISKLCAKYQDDPPLFQNLSFAMLWQIFSDNAWLAIINENLADDIFQQFSPEELQSEMRQIFEKINNKIVDEKIAYLTNQARKHGVSGLSSEEKSQLLVLMQQKKNRSISSSAN